MFFFSGAVAGVYDVAGLLPCADEAAAGFGAVELDDEVVEVADLLHQTGDAGGEVAQVHGAVHDGAAGAVEQGFVGGDARPCDLIYKPRFSPPLRSNVAY